MKRGGCWLAAVLSSLAALSCGSERQPLTQIMLVIRSDLVGIESVRVRIEGMGQPRMASASLEDKPLPRTLAIVHEGGPLGPIQIQAEARVEDETVLARNAAVSFVRGRNLMLILELDSSCVGVSCDDGKTCVAGRCEPAGVNASKLVDWPGSFEQPDAGAAGDGTGGAGGGGGRGGGGAGGSGPRAGSGGTTPDAGSGGSGGMSGGAGAGGAAGMPPPCGATCAFDSGVTEPHASLACVDGACLLSCEQGHLDVDRTLDNGCEVASVFPWRPSNVDLFDAAVVDAAAEPITVDCDATLDLGGDLGTDFDVCGQQLQAHLQMQADGSEVAVLPMKQLTVGAGSRLRLVGSRPVVLAVYGDANIAGEIDASAVGITPGAGGNQSCSPGRGSDGIAISSVAGGGGGGGFGTRGGDGATSSSSTTAEGGPGGNAVSESVLAPLRGGCAGGDGLAEGGQEVSGQGGGGGGGLQLSVAGKLTLSGTISAAGGGGEEVEDYGDGAGGGGSGGGLLIEATELALQASGFISANGGGGGEGGLSSGADPGSDGAHASTSAAPGGQGQAPGGAGASADSDATSAPLPACLGQCGGGGGGGGLGVVVLRSDDCQLDGTTSPAAQCAAHL